MPAFFAPRISPTPTDSTFPARPSSVLLGIGLVKSSEIDNFPKSYSLGIKVNQSYYLASSGLDRLYLERHYHLATCRLQILL